MRVESIITAEEREICQKAIDTWGKESQTRVAIEEMAELTKELCKQGRGEDNVDHIAEEIADVLIMVEQMVILHDCADKVRSYKEFKLERLKHRIQKTLQGG